MLTLRETTAHAMGIIAISQDGKKYINDILIPANHPRPVKMAKAYYVRTQKGEETKMEVFVIQGDAEAPLDNQIPFRYVVSGIRHIPRRGNQTRIRVQYSYDQNGVIHVEARQEDDEFNLPIRREQVPADMTRFSRPVEDGDPSYSSAKDSSSLSLYSKWAGISNIPTTKLDRFGNPDGEEFDLAPDGSFEGYRILILNLCLSATMNNVVSALIQKGFAVDLLNAVPSADSFSTMLTDHCQLWVISQQTLHFNREQVNAIRIFWESGGGIYIWGDNDPLNTDANYIVDELFGARMGGNYYARQVLSIQQSPGAPGIIENHLISTGLISFFEGDTIASITMAGGLKPLIYSSDGNVVTAFYEHNGKRALIDGAFTRLWDWDWGQSAGTARYIVNAAAWLANAERYAEPTSNRGDDSDWVPTW